MKSSFGVKFNTEKEEKRDIPLDLSNQIIQTTCKEKFIQSFILDMNFLYSIKSI